MNLTEHYISMFFAILLGVIIGFVFTGYHYEKEITKIKQEFWDKYL